MSRLTDKNGIAVCGSCNSWGICKSDESCFVKDVYKKLAHYEDMEEQGRLITLPCKVGDTVYTVRKYGVEYLIEELLVDNIRFWSGGAYVLEYLTENSCDLEAVITTKEEAQKRLEELKGKDNG